MSDETKKPEQSTKTDRIEDLQQPISDNDAQSVKGGRAPIKEASAKK